jgi:hypothetical protein
VERESLGEIGIHWAQGLENVSQEAQGFVGRGEFQGRLCPVGEERMDDQGRSQGDLRRQRGLRWGAAQFAVVGRVSGCHQVAQELKAFGVYLDQSGQAGRRHTLAVIEMDAGCLPEAEAQRLARAIGTVDVHQETINLSWELIHHGVERVDDASGAN